MGKLTELFETHKRTISIAMAVIVGLMVIDVVFQISRHVQWSMFIPDTLIEKSTTTQPADTQPAKDDKKSKKEKKPPPIKVAQAITTRNVFTKPKPKGHGMSLTGVLGNVALFNSRSGAVAIEEGKSGGGIKVKSINAYEVVIEYKGKDTTMKLFKDAKPKPKPKPKGGTESQPTTKTTTVTSRPTSQPTTKIAGKHKRNEQP